MPGSRVVVLTTTLPRWKGDSTPRFVLDLSLQLALLGWRMDVIAPGYEKAKAEDELEGLTVHRFTYAVPRNFQTLCYAGGILPNLRERPARAMLVPPLLVSAFLATRRLVRRVKPDLVHAHWIVPMGLVAALALPKSVPLVLTVHGSDALRLRGAVMNNLKSRVLARASVVTCNGSRTEEAIAPLLPAGKPCVRIPMGAKPAEAGAKHGVSLPQDRFKVLFAGRLIHGKGLDDLLEAVAAFGAGDRPMLLVAGTGPEAERFAARAASLAIAQDVHFLGGLEHERVLALMRDVDAVVVPTRNAELVEAQGLVIAESMFAGTPVIATSGGGAEDHVQHMANGLLVPPGESAAIADALRHLMHNPTAASAIGEAGRAYAREKLSWQACARAFDDVYESATSERREQQ